ncbi:MAG: hypothetical protein L6R28_25060 [Planctomycetes bacterium]|nr:hypothetical protein [Planctomycetota bacterium]
MSESTAVQESAAETQAPAEPAPAPRPNRGMLRDLPDYVSPPAPLVLQGLLGLGAGIHCGAVSFLLAAMAAGLGVPEAAGAMAACFLASLAWVANGLALRTGRRRPALWLLGTGGWAAGMVMLRLEAAQALLLAVRLVHPDLLYAAGLAVVLAMATAAVCVVRLVAPAAAASAPRPFRPLKALAALVYAGALVAFPSTFPGRLEASAAAEAQHFEQAYLPAKGHPLVLGACSEFQLGAGSPQGPVDSELRFAEVHAELLSLAASGAEAIVIGMAGTDYAPSSRADPAEAFEARCVEAVRAAGLKLVLADAPPPYISAEGVPWPEFARRHQERVLEYQRRYKPEAVVLCTGVQPYYRLGEITNAYKGARLPEEQNRPNVVLTPDHWEWHLANLAAQVKVQDPKALTAVCVQPWILEEREIYRRALAMPDLDAVAIQAYAKSNMVAADRMIHDFDIPQAHGKRLWIVGAWHGFALGDYRPPEETAQWLTGLAGWAQRAYADAVFVRPFGGFVEGGHLQAYRNGELAELWNRRSVPALSATCKRWLRLSYDCGRDWDVEAPKFDLEDIYERFDRLPPRAPKKAKEEKEKKEKPRTIEKPDEKRTGS